MGATATAAVVALAGPAGAHVTVNPDEAARGGYAKLAFRVPNESDRASTVKLTVSFPEETPLASVRVRPHPGWQATVQKTTFPEPVEVGDLVLEEAVTSVTWTADEGGGIAPGEFDEFEVSVGPLPDEDSLAFTAVQTYDDGEVVAWDQPVTDGPEPERPAPTLRLVDSADDHGHGQASDRTAQAAATGDATTSEATSGAGPADPTARTLGVTGLVAGLLGLVVAVWGRLAGRRGET
ncbi:YcnI family protein [Thermasporomyces composti]|uniref:YcnI family copper-binding membrane protein n=1 Tax=Thermasporomyces composti TaxID=696763 RepID=UPI001B85E79F|nr:YcnI family protein [Thermasporomyces composti]